MIASFTYVCWLYALGFYAVVMGGAGPDDLVPGTFLLLLTFPVSAFFLSLTPASWMGRIFGVFFVLVAPVANIALFQLLWSAGKVTATRVRRRRSESPARF